MIGGAKAHWDCVSEFIHQDWSEDLKKISVPVLAMNGDADQIVPHDTSGPRAVGHLGWLWEAVQAVGGLDRVAHGQVVRANDIGPVQGDEQRALHGPRADAAQRFRVEGDELAGVRDAAGETFGEA